MLTKKQELIGLFVRLKELRREQDRKQDEIENKIYDILSKKNSKEQGGRR